MPKSGVLNFDRLLLDYHAAFYSFYTFYTLLLVGRELVVPAARPVCLAW